MVGRFSSERAAEIKEARELAAELEAVQEGEQSWGMASGKRASRSAVKKSLKEPSEDEDEDEEEGEGRKSRSASAVAESKAKKLRDELAFLGNDSESDSD